MVPVQPESSLVHWSLADSAGLWQTLARLHGPVKIIDPKDSFMAEPTLLRLVGNYGVAEQDAEAIAAVLLTATTWFQTTSH